MGDMLSGAGRMVPAKIAGPEPVGEKIHMPQDQIDKLNTALHILATADPLLPDHLYKLAMIAKNDQATYDMLLGMLNKM
jgi:L-aminopeptidase/D-esterase-like protein